MREKWKENLYVSQTNATGFKALNAEPLQTIDPVPAMEGTDPRSLEPEGSV